MQFFPHFIAHYHSKVNFSIIEHTPKKEKEKVCMEKAFFLQEFKCGTAVSVRI